MWQLSGVTKPQPKLRIAPKLYKGKKDMRSRLKELMGIALAGNDNPELMVEMSKIVDRLEDKGWMSKEEIINSRRLSRAVIKCPSKTTLPGAFTLLKVRRVPLSSTPISSLCDCPLRVS